MILERPRSDWFGEPTRGEGNFRRRSVRGTVATAIGRAIALGLQLASLIVLARLLTPADFGLVAMVTAVIGITGVFQDLGLSAATVRAQQITREQVTNLFWINLISGVAIAVVIAALGPVLEAFYGDGRIGGIAATLALGIAVSGTGIQHGALLRRAMRYAELSRVAVVSAAASASVSVAGAYHGYGFWALVAGSLAGSLVSSGLYWNLCGWRPGIPRAGVGTRAMTRFGLHLTAFGTLAYLANNLPSVIIGRIWGPSATGLFTRAGGIGSRLRAHVIEPLRMVVPTTLARLVHEPEKYSDYYYTVCTLVVMAAMPLTFVCAVLPNELVAVLLGEQWQTTAALLRILAIGLLPQMLIGSIGWIYLSAGNSARMLQWGVVGWGAVIVAVLVGSRFGMEGIAVATSVSATMLLFPGLAFAFRGTPLRIAGLNRRLAPSFIAGCAAGIAAWMVLAWIPGSPFLRLVFGCVGYTLMYLTLLLAVPGQRRLIAEVLSHLSLEPTVPSRA